MSELTIGEGRVGIIHYTLRNGEGEILDSSQGRDPMPYLHGAENIVSGLERALDGKSAGDTVQVILAPADGYGELDDSEPQRVRRRELPGNQDWRIGMSVRVQAVDGGVNQLWISRAEGAWVWLTPNHPLAGMALNFDVSIVGVRSALQVERDHGHPHGIDGNQGHHH